MKLEEHRDFYMERGYMVLTSTFLAQRGYCCGNGCRHCPYIPKHGGEKAKLESPPPTPNDKPLP